MPVKKPVIPQNVQRLFTKWTHLQSEVAAEESRVQSLPSFIEWSDQIESLQDQADELENEIACAEIDGDDEDTLEELNIDLDFCRDDLFELEKQVAEAYRPGHGRRLEVLRQLRRTLEKKGWLINSHAAQKRPSLRRIENTTNRRR